MGQQVRKKQVEASISTNSKYGTVKYDNFVEVGYYDLDGGRNNIYVLPSESIMDLLEIEYTLEYDSDWDIYIIEFE